jgi:ribosomal protein L37E
MTINDRYIKINVAMCLVDSQGGPTYEIAKEGKGIKCLRCERTSWSSEDVKQKYCGACNAFHTEGKK